MANGPDFLCIGAQKAGTTWLYDNLRHHPKFWLPPIKELHYFDNKVPNKALLPDSRYDHGNVFMRYSGLLESPNMQTLRWLWRFNYHGNQSRKWYRSLFTESDKIMGDITPMYSTLDERGVEYVRNVVDDDCKVMLILREPVSRSWSAVKMYYRWKGTDVNHEDYSALIDEMKKPYSVLRTDYSRMIGLWRQYFSEDKFKIFFFDDLVKSPDQFLLQVLQYLGAADSEWQAPHLEKQSNSDGNRISMPGEVRTQMSYFFLPELETLSEMIGGYANGWLDLARENTA